MGEMRDSDWSRPNLLRSDWLPLIGAIMTTVVIEEPTVGNLIRMNLKLYYGEVLVKSTTNTPKETKYNTFINCWKNV